MESFLHSSQMWSCRNVKPSSEEGEEKNRLQAFTEIYFHCTIEHRLLRNEENDGNITGFYVCNQNDD